MTSSKIEILEKNIEDRKKRLSHKGTNLNVSLNKMQYSNKIFIGKYNKKYKNALFIGVGHGHDVLLSFFNSYISRADGVDPYYSSDGNDSVDYNNLLNLIDNLDLNKKFILHKQTIQTYLAKCNEKYDLIVLPDVLHHIFVTESLLEKSKLFDECTFLFQSLYKVSRDKCDLLISDAPRTGLRIILSNNKIIENNVDYKTKQPHKQWKLAIEKSGWFHQETEYYIPYFLKKFTFILKFKIFSWFFANRYFISFRK